MNQYPLELLIFDLDGTIANTLQDLANSVNYALEKLNRQRLELSTVTKYIGDGVRKFLQRALENPSPEELETSLSYFREYYVEHLAEFTRVYPGIPEVLHHFQDKKKVVLTNKPEEYALPLLRDLRLRHHFDLVVGGRPHLKLKPEPDGIRWILEQMNIRPQQAAMIGDSENDILAGQAANVYTVAALYGFGNPGQLRSLAPDFEIEHPMELQQLIP